jgi:ABC-type multidrug transport system fused ATPase/permease subunit
VDGQIAEIGSHDELELKAGAFWSLYLGQGAHVVARPAGRAEA